jgi:hypothetical protein
MGLINEWEDYEENEDYPDEEYWERQDREDAEWECLYPGECVMGFSLLHHSSECYTAEQARAFEREMQREGA